MTSAATIKESDLYAPVKAFFEQQGYEVKGEVLDCDLMAIKDKMPNVIVELKLSFSLDLIFQAIERLKLCDDVYVAIPAPNTPLKRKNWRAKQKSSLLLCKRLGIGLLTVELEHSEACAVKVLLDPQLYKPRGDHKKRTKLQREFVSRKGDQNIGGVTRTRIITAYRQDSLLCANTLASYPQLQAKELKLASGIAKTASILQQNYYGWFERVSRGVYKITPTGQAALDDNQSLLKEICPTP